jgi:hypothetical protein
MVRADRWANKHNKYLDHAAMLERIGLCGTGHNVLDMERVSLPTNFAQL